MEKYNFTETKDNIFWDEFILQSENKNIYTLSDYLSLEDNIKFFIIKGFCGFLFPGGITFMYPTTLIIIIHIFPLLLLLVQNPIL